MADPEKALAAIPFGNIIGGPLVAAVEAQAKAAQSTTEFINAVAFKSDGSGDLNTVDFKYVSGGTDVTLTVPLLSILPVPFIRIDDMTIQFKANISAESSLDKTEKKSTDTSLAASVSGGYFGIKASFNASYSAKKDSTAAAHSKYAVEYTMDVYVHAVQDDMPAGLAKVLNLLTDSIQSPPSSAATTTTTTTT